MRCALCLCMSQAQSILEIRIMIMAPRCQALKASRRTRMHWDQAREAYCVPRLTWKRLMRVNFAMRYLVKARVKSGRAGTLAKNLVAEVKPQIVSQIWSRPPSRVRC